MKRRKIEYFEGMLFVLPMRDGGFARGLVSRFDGKGAVLGYFFGPRLASVDEVMAGDEFLPESAILVGRFGDLGLLNGAWHPYGKIASWSRESWPLPVFTRSDNAGIVISRYGENLKFIGEHRLPPNSISPPNSCADGLMGYGYVEVMLTKLLKK